MKFWEYMEVGERRLEGLYESEMEVKLKTQVPSTPNGR